MQHRPALIDGSTERRTGRPGPADIGTAAPDPGPGRDIRLTLPANAQNVVLIRQVIAAHAGAAGLGQQRVDDLKLAVTEACTNVVRHAYPGAPGTVQVEVSRQAPDLLTILVADQGRGIEAGPGSTGDGLGLPLLAALADELEIDGRAGCGSRVRMSFRQDG